MLGIRTIKKGSFKNQQIDIEGLWTSVYGTSWMFSNGNPVALEYAIRSARDNLPTDDKVYYGKINNFGYLVHESELEGN